ncbi:hypothetical protein ACOMHN_019387 [Nucella lapillus]
MASAASDTSDKLSCSVCCAHYKVPKLLPCGHLLCRHCLLSWMQSREDAGCPLCRSLIVEADGGRMGSLEGVAEGLPTDLSMVRLVEAERLLNKQHQCCACEQVVATCLCLDCRDMMCKSCAKIHIKFSNSKTHVIEELCDLTPEKLAANHWSCQQPKKAKQKIREARAVLAQLEARLKEGQAAMDRGLQQLDRHLQETESRSQALIAEIDALCEQLKEQVHTARRQAREGVQEGRTCLQQRKGKAACHQRVVERVKVMQTAQDMKTMTAVMKERLDDMDLSATLPPGAKVVCAVSLEIDTEALSSCWEALSSCCRMIAELGRVRTSPADLSLTAQPEEILWSFHKNCSWSIALTNDNRTAGGVAGLEGGVVMACDPMERGFISQVEVNEVSSRLPSWSPRLGVTVQAPHTVSSLDGLLGRHPFVIWIDYNSVVNQGTKTRSRLGDSLENVRAGSRVGVALDGQSGLHLYVDGTDRGVFASRVPQPCFFFMILGPVWKGEWTGLLFTVEAFLDMQGEWTGLWFVYCRGFLDMQGEWTGLLFTVEAFLDMQGEWTGLWFVYCRGFLDMQGEWTGLLFTVEAFLDMQGEWTGLWGSGQDCCLFTVEAFLDMQGEWTGLLFPVEAFLDMQGEWTGLLFTVEAFLDMQGEWTGLLFPVEAFLDMQGEWT